MQFSEDGKGRAASGSSEASSNRGPADGVGARVRFVSSYGRDHVFGAHTVILPAFITLLPGLFASLGTVTLAVTILLDGN